MALQMGVGGTRALAHLYIYILSDSLKMFNRNQYIMTSNIPTNSPRKKKTPVVPRGAHQRVENRRIRRQRL